MRCFQAVKTDSALDKSNITLFFTGAHSLEVCKDNAIGISETKPKGLFLCGDFIYGSTPPPADSQNAAFYLCAGCFIIARSFYKFLSMCPQETLWPFHLHNMVCICSIWVPLY